MLERLTAARARVRGDEVGQTAVEYTLALVLFALVLAMSVAVLAGALAATPQASSNRASSPTGTNSVEIPPIPVMHARASRR